MDVARAREARVGRRRDMARASLKQDELPETEKAGGSRGAGGR